MLELPPIDLALSTTRSVRKRIDFDRSVPPELIERCIDVATQAPTGLEREAWRFLVVTDSEPKQQIAALYRKAFDAVVSNPVAELGPSYRHLAETLQDFPCLILVCSKGRPEADNTAQQVAFYGSVLPAAWSLMVCLRARGLGSTWTTLLVRHEEPVAEALGIPADVTQTVLLPVGFTKEAVLRPAPRKPAHEVTYWNRWGRRRSD
jgi:nitroreductase